MKEEELHLANQFFGPGFQPFNQEEIAMQWILKRPTDFGFYWVRRWINDDWSPPAIVQVGTNSKGELMASGTQGDEFRVSLNANVCEWYGPIEAPELPPPPPPLEPYQP